MMSPTAATPATTSVCRSRPPVPRTGAPAITVPRSIRRRAETPLERLQRPTCTMRSFEPGARTPSIVDSGRPLVVGPRATLSPTPPARPRAAVLLSGQRQRGREGRAEPVEELRAELGDRALAVGGV